MMIDYYYGNEGEMFTFYRIPKALFTHPYFKRISTEAKVLYGLLLDRMSLSVKNNWLDEQGRIFIIFTIDEIMDALSCAEHKAVNLLHELEKDVQVIERKRQGLGKPNLIYVKKFVDNSVPKPEKSTKTQFLNCQNSNSGIAENAVQELSESQTTKTDKNKTDKNDTDIFPIPSSLSEHLRRKETKGSEGMDERNRTREYLEDKLEIAWLKKSYPYDTDVIDEIFEILVDTLCSKRTIIRIAGDDKPIEVVKSVFMKLDSSHIQFALDCFKKNTTEVRNIRAYMMTTLYNAPHTISSYYTSLVHHDMPYLAE